MAVADERAPHGGYEAMVSDIGPLLREHVPPEAPMLVAGGVEDLLGLGPGAREFPDPAAPQDYDATGLAAIAQLEAERARGAHFLLIPAAERWRLDEDSAFERHLGQRYRLLADDDLAVLFALRAPPDESSVWRDLRRMIARCERELDRDPVILDWNTHLNLRAQFPALRVFPPIAGDPSLPYIDETIDVVAIPASATPAEIAEARRVASLAIASLPASPTGGPLDVEWKRDGGAGLQATVIVPCLDSSENGRAAIFSLHDTLDGIDAEVLLACGAGQLDGVSPARAWAAVDDRVRRIEVAEDISPAAACDLAAKVAANEILVFLSAAGCPLDEWLSPLLRIFREHPNAAAVGGKVLTDRGELIHAGGELLADGSPHVRGLGAPPEDPMHSCVRAVDFVSPALLATPREVFTAAGGFDPRAASAAMDYCLGLGREGHGVYYQPASTVILLELSATPGFPTEAETAKSQDRR